MIPPCRKVVVVAGCKIPPIGYVEKGGCIKHLQTELGAADACWVSPTFTELAEVEDVAVREEGAYYIMESGSEVYVYPAQVIREVMDWWKSCTPLAIFTGPPGTGKTSLATALLPALVGADADWLTTAHIISKYVGESEKNMRRVIERVVESRPKIAVIDEGDDLVSAGDRSVGGERSVGRTQNVLKSMLAWMAHKCAKDQSFSTAKAVVTTNLPEAYILPEFRRRGRGQIITVPLPDKKGYSLLLSLLEAKYKISFPTDFAEYAARRLTPADVVDYALRLAKGEKPPLPTGIVSTLPVPQDYRPPPPAGPACQRLLAGMHYHAEVRGARTPLHKVHAVVDFIASCGTPPVVIRKLDKEHVEKSIALALTSKRPIVVFPPVPVDAYLAMFYDVREVPVVFAEGIFGGGITLEPLPVYA